jgi:hypothetical protein
MARRKSRKKSSGKRRVGGPGKDFVMEMAGLSAFVLFGGKITALIPATISPTIVGAGEIGVGFLAAKKVKNPFLRGAAMGLAATGVLTIGKSMGLVSGAPGAMGNFQYQRRVGAPGAYPAMSTIGNPAEDMSGISGVGNEMSVISGMEDWDENYGDDD